MYQPSAPVDKQEWSDYQMRCRGDYTTDLYVRLLIAKFNTNI